MDNSLSASTITEDPAKPPLCTYLLPATAESDLPISTRLKFAKDTVLARLNLVSSLSPSSHIARII